MQEIAVLIAGAAKLDGKVAVSRAGAVLLLAKPRPLPISITANYQIRVAVTIGDRDDRAEEVVPIADKDLIEPDREVTAAILLRSERELHPLAVRCV